MYLFRAAPRNSARSLRQDFAPIQSLENEGILYVFLVFQTEEVGQKGGGDSQTQLCGVAFDMKKGSMSVHGFFSQSGAQKAPSGEGALRLSKKGFALF